MNKKKEILPRWDLSDLYSGFDSKELKSDVMQIKKQAVDFSLKYRGKLASLNGEEFGEAIVKYEQLFELVGKLETYAYLMHSVKLDDTEVSANFQKIREVGNWVCGKLLFFTLEINQLSKENFNDKLKSEVVNKYSVWLKNVNENKPHELNETLERYSLDKSLSGASAWCRLFDETMSGLRFNIQGKEYTEPEALNLLLSNDQKLRLDAGTELNNVMKKNIKIFSLITNTLAKDKQTDDEWRNYQKPVSARNIENQVEDNVVQALVDSVVRAQSDIAYRYYELKAKWLGVDKLTYWDRNAPLPFVDEDTYTWEETKNIVLSAYKEFCPKMAEIGQKFFDAPWIDVPPDEGKEGGAYAHPVVPSVHPYLMLNFMGTTNDVMTLAHELGHGIHQYLARKNGYFLSDTPLTLAETASVFGEMIVFKYMLRHEKDEKKRFALLAEKTGSMLNTSVRQIAFHRFEQAVHTRRRIEGELTSEQLSDIWTKVQNDALGPFVINDENSNAMWASIPHLIHTPFYVYSYAFGDCLVNSLYHVYETKSVADFENKYVEMLSKGGSERHRQLLAPFGLDASKQDFWEQGLNIVHQFVDELEVLTKKLMP
ncbi:MAG: M3 family oligoendopeptidase [Alphaproteobacteria bacterium]|nr:M3 family oligoendopeptidase [Alphaproteobacteria bacterium]